jgi:hypothetical protein
MMTVKYRQPPETDLPAAQIRGDIQKGYAGDKVPGFDPAAAPLETDAEAAGTHQPAMPERPTYRSVKGANSSSHGTAMRPFEADQSSRRPLFWFIIVALALAAALAWWLWSMN